MKQNGKLNPLDFRSSSQLQLHKHKKVQATSKKKKKNEASPVSIPSSINKILKQNNNKGSYLRNH